MELQKFCNGTIKKLMKMEVFDFEDKKTSEAIGHCMFTVEDLKNGKKDF